MGGLTDFDRRVAESFRTARVLDDVRSHQLDHTSGAIVVTCGDGDQMYDLYGRHCAFYEAHHLATNGHCPSSPRIHVLALNGGGLNIPARSPLLRGFAKGEILLDEIRATAGLKSMRTVVLYAHLPCGAARLAGVDFLSATELMFAAKERVRLMFPEFTVAAFCHVDKGAKRTYFLDRANWLAWRESLDGLAFLVERDGRASAR